MRVRGRLRKTHEVFLYNTQKKGGGKKGSTVNKWLNNTIRNPRAAMCEREIG